MNLWDNSLQQDPAKLDQDLDQQGCSEDLTLTGPLPVPEGEDLQEMEVSPDDEHSSKDIDAVEDYAVDRTCVDDCTLGISL